jgi:predicted RNase H-like HicB family nuclease
MKISEVLRLLHDDGRYCASVRDLPGCIATGGTLVPTPANGRARAVLPDKCR